MVYPEALGGGPGGQVGPQSPPSIVTEAPEDVTDVSATFVATLTSNDRPCFVYFRYFQGASGYATGQVLFGGSKIPTRVTIPVVGLTPGTISSCRAWAFHSVGPFANQVVSGSSVAFTTLPASGATLPDVQALPATNVTATTATLNARANPNGLATLVEVFAVDETTGAQFPITAVNIGAGTAFVDVSGDITGLNPETPYKVVARATSTAGSVTSGGITFTTDDLGAGVPPLITASTTTLINPTNADIRVDFDTGGLDCDLFIQWGTTTAYGSSQNLFIPAVNTSAVATLTPLLAATGYHWIARISNAIEADDGDDVPFTTGSVGTPPTGRVMLASRIRDQTARLNAEFNPQGTATNVVMGYAESLFDLSSQSGTYATKNAVPANQGGSTMTAFAANIQNLQVGKIYYYRPQANNSGGSTFGDVGVFQTADVNTGTTAAQIISETATDIEINQATLSASIDTHVETTSWCFEYWITGQPVKQSPIQLVIKALGDPDVLNTVAAIVSGLTPNQAYNYRVALSSSNSDAVQYGATQIFTTDPVPTNPAAVGSIDVVTVVNQTTAQFSGTVNPMGTATTVVFQVSLTANFAAIAATSASYNAGSGSVTVPVPPVNIATLTPATHYWARAQFTNNAGANVSYSANTQEFDTAGSQLCNVTTLPNPPVTQQGANLGMSVTMPAASGNHFASFEYQLNSLGAGPPYTTKTGETNLGPGPNTLNHSVGVGLGGAGAPLIPNTAYRFRAFCRNQAGTSFGIERTLTTTNAPPTTLPNPLAQLTETPGFVWQGAGTPNCGATHFYMRGKVTLNAVAADVSFEYTLDPNFVTGIVTTAVQTMTPTLATEGDEPMVAEQLHFLTPSTASVNSIYFWRIKAVNVNGTVYSNVLSAWMSIAAPQAASNTTQTVNDPPLFSTSGMTTMMKDDEKAVIRVKVWHKGVRHWGRFEWTTQADFNANAWANSIKGRLESKESHTVVVGGVVPNTRWFQELEGLTAATAYVWRFRCWNKNGESLLTTTPTGTFTTDAAASWLGTLGTQTPRGNVNFEMKSDFRNNGSASISETQDVVFGADEYVPGGAEDTFTILVTPTLVTTVWNGSTYVVNDGPNGTTPTQRAIVKALQLSRIGDIIRVDSSTFHLYQGSDAGGSGNANTDAFWSPGLLGARPITGIRIQPKSKAAGNFRWQGLAISGDKGGINGIVARYCDAVRWSSDLRNWYMSSGGLYTVQLADAGGPGYGMLGFYDCVFGVGEGTLNAPGTPYDGLISSNPDYQGYGVRTHIRANAPCTLWLVRCKFSQGQEHSAYGNGRGAFNSRPGKYVDCEIITAAIGARPGVARIAAGPNGGGIRAHVMSPSPQNSPTPGSWGWDLANYHEGQLANRNTFSQDTSRADEVLAGNQLATGPGSPPGRGPALIQNLIARCRPN